MNSTPEKRDRSGKRPTSQQRLGPGAARSAGAEERPEKARHLQGPAAAKGIPAVAAGLPGGSARLGPPALPRPPGAPAGRCDHVRGGAATSVFTLGFPPAPRAPPLPRPPRAHWRPAPPARRRALPRARHRRNAPLPLRVGEGAPPPPRLAHVGPRPRRRSRV